VTGREPSSKTNNVYGGFNGRPASAPRVTAEALLDFSIVQRPAKKTVKKGSKAVGESSGTNRASEAIRAATIRAIAV
jgi:hypothetical protein